MIIFDSESKVEKDPKGGKIYSLLTRVTKDTGVRKNWKNKMNLKKWQVQVPR